MSLVQYKPSEGREIVLRHQHAMVIRDPDSQRLEIRRMECPTCHQPLDHASSTERSAFERQYNNVRREFVNPNYFRMLRASNHHFNPNNGPLGSVRRLFHPILSRKPLTATMPHGRVLDEHATDLSPTPAASRQAEGSRIRKDAFSPNYFSTFFVEERVLGRGGKGVVLLARHEIDGCQLGHFACKRVPVGDDHAWLEKVLVEVELLAKLSHPNLVSYRHVWLEDMQLTRFGPSVACAFILQQFCNAGDLHQFVIGAMPQEFSKEELKARMRRRSKGQAEPFGDSPGGKRRRLPFDDIFSIFRDITSGVAYLHSANYVHRDLKPSNCLLHQEGNKMICLISDFGEVQPEDMVRMSTGSTGTISYCAPEVLKRDAAGNYGNFTTKSDMFSLGMILYFMCFGRLPYQGANALEEELEDIEQLRAEIVDWRGFEDERRERADLPARLYKLLRILLATDVDQRPSANEVLSAMRSETNFDGVVRADRALTSSSGVQKGPMRSFDPSLPKMPGNPEERVRDELMIQDSSSFERDSSLGPNGNPHDIQQEDNVTPPPEDQTSSSFPSSECIWRDDKSLAVTLPLLMVPPRAENEGWDSFFFVGRLVLFCLKLATLAHPCWPYAARLELSVPLMSLAALDLALPGKSSEVCPSVPSANYRVGNRRLRTRSLWVSSTLLMLHFLILWHARRWNVLCVFSARNEWDDGPLKSAMR